MRINKFYFYIAFLAFAVMKISLHGEKQILDNGISEKPVNLAEKYRKETLRNAKLQIFFDAIKRHNNKYVINRLAIRENLEKDINNKETVNEDIFYGPKYEEIAELTKEGKQRQELIDVNTVDKDGFTPVITAIEYKNNQLLKVLIENGANLYEKHPIFDKLTLHTASYYENEEAVKMILEANPKLVNIKSGVDGWTALHDATLKSNSEIVKILLEYGANPLISDNKGGTPMDMATEFGKGEIVKILRDHIKKNRK